MVVIQNHLGKIRYTRAFFTTLISSAVTSCFGVAGLMPCNKYEDFITSFPVLRKFYNESKGINIRITEGKVRIALHIAVAQGTNTAALTDNIQEKLSFIINEQTGLKVEKVDVYIDDLVN